MPVPNQGPVSATGRCSMDEFFDIPTLIVIGVAIFVLVAAIWFVPDRRFSRVLEK